MQQSTFVPAALSESTTHSNGSNSTKSQKSLGPIVLGSFLLNLNSSVVGIHISRAVADMDADDAAVNHTSLLLVTLDSVLSNQLLSQAPKKANST